MRSRWVYQVRGMLHDGLDHRTASDLAGLIANGGGQSNALVLPRSDHPLPRHLPYAFAEGLGEAEWLTGPGFGYRLGYDGSRFDGIRGARVSEGELMLGICCDGLERDVDLGLDSPSRDGFVPGAPVYRLEALLGFLSRVLAGPEGEVVGRMRNQGSRYGHPLIRCADGLIRLVHASGLQPNPGVARTLPRSIPPRFVEIRDGAQGDLREEDLADWLARRSIDGDAAA